MIASAAAGLQTLVNSELRGDHAMFSLREHVQISTVAAKPPD